MSIGVPQCFIGLALGNSLNASGGYSASTFGADQARGDELAADDQLAHLGRAGADFQQLDGPVQAIDLGLPDVAGAAVDLAILDWIIWKLAIGWRNCLRVRARGLSLLSRGAYLFSASLWFNYGISKRDKMRRLHRLGHARRVDHRRSRPSSRSIGVGVTFQRAAAHRPAPMLDLG